MSDFEDAFSSLSDEVSIRSLLPKMSTVVYEVGCNEWNPQGVYEMYAPEEIVTEPLPINDRDGVAWFVAEHRSPVEWGEANAVENLTYALYVIYWDRGHSLLYINSSEDSLHEDLATAICGEGAARVTGERVYRVLGNIERLVPTNLGVLDVRNRNRRFSMFVGTSVEEGMLPAETQTKTKTNLFAWGYEKGDRVSIGASRKGRIWSYRVAKSLKHWVDWCDFVGSKLMDETIDVSEIMRNFIHPVELRKRPRLVPLGLEWPWELLVDMRDRVVIERGDSEWPLIDSDLDVRSFTDSGPIQMRVSTPDWYADYEITIQDGQMHFVSDGPDPVVRGLRSATTLSEYLNRTGLQIYFERDAVVTPEAVLHQPPREVITYDRSLLLDLDWTGIDLSIESQGEERRAYSIQAHMIEHMKMITSWDIILDDDSSNEIADIVALRVDGHTLHIHLTHCKFILKWTERTRNKQRKVIHDLYEVCGQAMKSVRWRRDISALLQNLIRRQKNYFNRTGKTGFMIGSERKLLEILDQSRSLRPQFTIAIAQPGLQKSKASDRQLELLAATETYVRDVTNGFFKVYCDH